MSPPRYQEVTLKNVVAKIDYGVTASATDSVDGPRFLRITDIKENGVNWNSVPGCNYKRNDIQRFELKEGDIVFARTGATTGKSYLIKSCPKNAIFASYLIRIRPSLQVHAPYLAYFFQTPNYWSQVSLSSSGSAQAGVNASKLKNLKIPLPPLEEQRRIAAILDEADSLRRKQREAIAMTEELLRSVFLEMFGDPVTNPKGWPLKRLGQVGTLDRGKSKHRPRNDPALLGGPYPLIQTGDVANSDGVITEFQQTYSELGLSQSRLWPVGTLCITIAANIAQTGVLTFKACFPDSIVGFHPGPSVTVEYVQTWLDFLQPIVEAKATQVAQKNINLAVLRGLEIPVPPPTLLNRHAKSIQCARSSIAKEQAALSDADKLFNGLMQKAFKGRL